MTTHTVENQAAPRTEIDEFSANTALVEAVRTYAPAADLAELSRIGAVVGSASFQHDAALVHEITPRHSSHDRWGHRVDHVEFHPGYHRIIGEALAAGAHSSAWQAPGPGANAERAARFMLFSQVEPGHACPVSMTHSAVAALQGTPHADFWVPRLLSREYDPRLVDAAGKTAVTFGMAMTEKQGGSDVRANTTRAVPYEGAAQGFGGVTEGHFLLTGHKWFCSAPQSDAFLVLAQREEGVSCFLVPRILPGGERNPLHVQRLKDKLGNRSNASSEIELDGAHGWLVGEPGRGVRTIIEMVSRTRLDCILGSAAGMRQAVAEAAWHVSHRSAFGARLIDQPLMRAVIADLQLETEAATWTALHIASAHDAASAEAHAGQDTASGTRAPAATGTTAESGDATEFRRIATAVAKYWVCKRGPEHAYEALECLGGNGYTESFPLAMRYREQPVMAVWEGSGNVIVLDVIRALSRSPQSAKAFLAYLETGLGRYADYDGAYERLAEDLTRAASTIEGGDAGAMAQLQQGGRVLVERMALLLQAAVLQESAPEAVAESFVLARLGADRGREYGALPPGAAIDLLVERAVGSTLTRARTSCPG